LSHSGEIRCKNLAHKTDDDGLNEITQRVYHDTVEHSESKERLGKLRVLP